MATAPSTCPLDCPDRCTLDVTVEGGRVTALRGSRRTSWTAGYICSKVASFDKRVHGDLRISTPMRRVGPKGPGATFEPISWDEALDIVVSQFRSAAATHGAESILPVWYGGSNGILTGGAMDVRFWTRLGASQCGRTLCAANTGAGAKAVYGGMASADMSDVEHTDLVILWGVNPSASGIHLAGAVKALQKRGGSLIVVDPRRSPLLRPQDLHLAPLPGTDVPLALALMYVAITEGLVNEAFLAQHAEGWGDLRAAALEWSPERAAEVTGVPAADIVRAARLYAATPRALVRCGWGVERNRNGTDSIKAVLSLPAVFGKFGVRGGGYAMSTSSGYRVDARSYQGTPSTTRTINLSQLAHALATVNDPPIKVAYVYNCNPIATVPDQRALIGQFARDDIFYVVHEQVWTDTCWYADIVLPATTFLEHTELSKSYATYSLHWATAAIPPVGQARANTDVFLALAERLGFAHEAPFRDTAEDIGRAMLASMPSRPDFDALVRDGSLELPHPIQFVDTFPPTKIQLAPAPRHRPPPLDAELPLILVSPACSRAISSTGFETLPAGTAQVDLHPDDAARRGIVDGARVRVWSSLAEVVLNARITTDVRPGVASIPKGLWRNGTHNGLTAAALAPGHVDELGGGACYNDARVDVAAM
jgi:anaerobic selenocysteine-containing dehydrogenase